ncbi:MAG TPA: glycoside hydrolase family 3 N-terminal domain-containing protein [Gammaproteobacteria bacterium]|nr:glycoside hydrolase family 3 N-terminal domain-containing protein [Gammaproteobacteria bacterium]
MRRREFLARAAVCGSAVPLALSWRGATAQGAPARWSALDGAVRPLLARMTLDEKLGQMAQGELNQIKDEGDVERYFLGSVLSGGDADPKEGNGLVAWADTIDRLIERSMRTRLKVPILYGVDAVHGHSNVEGATIFPHNVGLGCTRDAALVEEIGRITALEMRATGAQWTFAPCVAAPRDERWGRTYEGFSESPEVAGELGAAAIRGLQEGGGGRQGAPRAGRARAAGSMSPRSVLACAKHYVGDGGTSYEPRELPGGRTTLLDQGDTRVDEATLRRIHLPAYAAAVAAGVGSIMVSYSSWNGVKVSGSPHLLTDILKNELGFEGFLISDYYAIGQIDRDYKTAVMHSINAGMDMAMEPAGYARFIATLRELVDEGRVPLARVDDAVTRILRVKLAMGLMDPKRSQLADRSLHASFGSAEHRDVARRSVRESLVLLKNDGRVLPLAKNAARIHVAGRAADDIGIQCGGWTVTWQGHAGATTAGTTLLQGIKAAVSPRASVTYDLEGGGPGADVAIVVVGEQPYAEGVGDRRDLALSPDNVALVERVAATGVRVVVVVLSGRPLILGPVLERASAVVAAWLPGTEGAGVADVLFGDFAPRGKLSYSWPRAMADVPVNVGDAAYAPLFPFGFGLGY